ncbi:hypothetical protein Dimus_000788 [Dionaea muscipula]
MSIAIPTPLRASQISALPGGEEVTAIAAATNILTIIDVEEMVQAFLTPESYQFGLPRPGKSVVDYIDHDTLCIHLEHFTRGLRPPLPHLEKAVEASSCLFDTVFTLLEDPGKTDYCTVEPYTGFKLVQDLPETPVISKKEVHHRS